MDIGDLVQATDEAPSETRVRFPSGSGARLLLNGPGNSRRVYMPNGSVYQVPSTDLMLDPRGVVVLQESIRYLRNGCPAYLAGMKVYVISTDGDVALVRPAGSISYTRIHKAWLSNDADDKRSPRAVTCGEDTYHVNSLYKVAGHSMDSSAVGVIGRIDSFQCIGSYVFAQLMTPAGDNIFAPITAIYELSADERKCVEHIDRRG